MQVQFVLYLELPTLEALESTRRKHLAAVAQYITGGAYIQGFHATLELAKCFVLVAIGHARRRLRRRLAWR